MAKRPKPKAPAKPRTRRIAAAAAKALVEGREALAAATPAPVSEPPPATEPKPPKADAVRLLTAENAKLTIALETAANDTRLATAAATKAAAQIETLTGRNKALADDLAAVRQSLAKAEAEIAQLKASGDPHSEGPLVLTAESVSTLLGEFVASFEGKLGNLQLGGSEVKLRAGFAQAAGKAAFVVPSATAPRDAVEGIHEIRLQLDPRTGG